MFAIFLWVKKRERFFKSGATKKGVTVNGEEASHFYFLRGREGCLDGCGVCLLHGWSVQGTYVDDGSVTSLLLLDCKGGGGEERPNNTD